jgi:hypothetical protein
MKTQIMQYNDMHSPDKLKVSLWDIVVFEVYKGVVVHLVHSDPINEQTIEYQLITKKNSIGIHKLLVEGYI